MKKTFLSLIVLVVLASTSVCVFAKNKGDVDAPELSIKEQLEALTKEQRKSVLKDTEEERYWISLDEPVFLKLPEYANNETKLESIRMYLNETQSDRNYEKADSTDAMKSIEDNISQSIQNYGVEAVAGIRTKADGTWAYATMENYVWIYGERADHYLYVVSDPRLTLLSSEDTGVYEVPTSQLYEAIQDGKMGYIY